MDPPLVKGKYFPVPPVSEEARKQNEDLPGMGGVFNPVNLNVYHYAGLNPVKMVDSDGEAFFIPPAVYGIVAGCAYFASTPAGQHAIRYSNQIIRFAGVYGMQMVARYGPYIAQNVWALDKFVRGRVIERMLGGMGNNFPTIDRFRLAANNIATNITSIKSINLRIELINLVVGCTARSWGMPGVLRISKVPLGMV